MSFMDSIEKGFSRVNSGMFKRVNRNRDWWELPKPLALLNLRAYRDDMRQANLYDTRDDGPAEPTPLDKLPKYRTYDGSLQDPTDPEMGKVGSRFGRNVAPDAAVREPMPQMMEPSPREVATRLLHRDVFKPAETLNLIAGCWIHGGPGSPGVGASGVRRVGPPRGRLRGTTPL